MQVRFTTECCCGCVDLTVMLEHLQGPFWAGFSCSAACAPALGFLPASRSCSADPCKAFGSGDSPQGCLARGWGCAGQQEPGPVRLEAIRRADMPFASELPHHKSLSPDSGAPNCQHCVRQLSLLGWSKKGLLAKKADQELQRHQAIHSHSHGTDSFRGSNQCTCMVGFSTGGSTAKISVFRAQ